MKVNIIGRAPGWQAAPKDGICWGLNSHILKRPYNVIFDMHDIEEVFTDFRTENWKLVKGPRRDLLPESIKKCEENDVTIFSLGQNADRMCVAYPIDKIKNYFGSDYFGSGIPYMIALAIYQGFTEIDIWGVFLSVSDEYAYQKPSIEFWIGMAMGRGIKVTVHGMTRLLKNIRDQLYGYQTKQEVAE